ncbi:MAG TPA: hypothetical protein IAB86_03875 [Candidatus Aphodovivens avicola]|nr:hypothetical protein [Candidatus Aphodovivens avicola]
MRRRNGSIDVRDAAGGVPVDVRDAAGGVPVDARDAAARWRRLSTHRHGGRILCASVERDMGFRSARGGAIGPTRRIRGILRIR